MKRIIGILFLMAFGALGILAQNEHKIRQPKAEYDDLIKNCYDSKNSFLELKKCLENQNLRICKFWNKELLREYPCVNIDVNQDKKKLPERDWLNSDKPKNLVYKNLPNERPEQFVP